MARRVPKPTPSNTTGTKPSRNHTSKPTLKDYLLRTRDMLASHQFQLIIGIILSTITVMLVIAFVSFFFTGGNDYSIIYLADRQALRNEIQNTLGLPGAVVARWLIDGTFGIASGAALVAMVLYCAHLITSYSIRRFRVLFITLFVLVWGSIALGFVHELIGTPSFFRWGGAFGETVARWGMSYVQWLGMSLILLSSMIVFLVIVDKHFVDHCQAFGQWVKSLFKKKEAEETEAPTVEQEPEAQPIEITLSPDDLGQEADMAGEEEAPATTIVVDVEQPTEEDIVVEEEEEVSCMSGIADRPYCKGRNYDPNRYASNSTEE